MKFISWDQYKDGGTVVIETNEGKFYIDHSIGAGSIKGGKVTFPLAGRLTRELGDNYSSRTLPAEVDAETRDRVKAMIRLHYPFFEGDRAIEAFLSK